MSLTITAGNLVTLSGTFTPAESDAVVDAIEVRLRSSGAMETFAPEPVAGADGVVAWQQEWTPDAQWRGDVYVVVQGSIGGDIVATHQTMLKVRGLSA